MKSTSTYRLAVTVIAVSTMVPGVSCVESSSRRASGEVFSARTTADGAVDVAHAAVDSRAASDLPTADPATLGVSLQPLVDMTNWVHDNRDVRIFSLLLSRHGQLVYELYSPGIVRDEAHFMMSTTKSVTSALVGAALDRGLLPGTDAPVSAILPAWLLGESKSSSRFGKVSLKDVMGMSALDADEPPRDDSAAAVLRGQQFVAAPNRVRFALTQALLPRPGTSFQYNDITPMLAGGAVQYATGKRLFDFGEEALFGPMGFKNHEWVGQDQSGIDLASYGLRLRPMDMQKFGILYLNHGRWGARQLLSKGWVDTSWTAYMHTGSNVTPGYQNYGWFWWHRSDWGSEIHWAAGWRGQFIIDIPAYDAVFTMTADIETGDEVTVLASFVTHYIIPALTHGAPDKPESEQALVSALASVHQGRSRVNLNGDPRMIPSVGPQAIPIPFNPTTK